MTLQLGIPNRECRGKGVRKRGERLKRAWEKPSGKTKGNEQQGDKCPSAREDATVEGEEGDTGKLRREESFCRGEKKKKALFFWEPKNMGPRRGGESQLEGFCEPKKGAESERE